MKRMVVGALGLTIALSSALNVAEAAPKKKVAKVAKTEQRDAPQSAEISKAMGELKWGMDREDVFQKFTAGVKEKYRPLMAKATGAIEEDKLRAKMRDELQRIRSSIVEFNGTKNGWDVSFLKSEFTHNNSESMFAVNDENSQNYYFFIQGKLWKWYKAFNASAFQGKTFDQFASAIQDRYGKAKQAEGELSAGQGKTHWLEWQDQTARLRAVDNTQFYGFYCLVFESKDTLRKLPELRASKQDGPATKHALVDSVTNQDEAQPGDGDADVMDRITGKIRHRQDAPAAAGAPAAGAPAGKKAATAASQPATTAGGVKTDDDPLKGLL